MAADARAGLDARRPDAVRPMFTQRQLTALAVFAAALLIAAAVLLAATALAPGPSRQSGERLRIAHITDPHLFEEPGKRTWDQDEVEDREAFADAMDYLRADSIAHGRAADVLVITGDWGLDPSFVSSPLRSGTTALTREAEVNTVADLIARSPVRHVLTVLGNNDLEGERSSPLNLKAFNTFFDSVGTRLKPRGSTIRNLTECYAGEADSTCVEDVGPVRFVGFASGSFKNEPLPTAVLRPAGSPPTSPPLATARGSSGSIVRDDPKCTDAMLEKLDQSGRSSRATASERADGKLVAQFARIVAEGARSQKRMVILTHEPDIDDPYWAEVVRDCAQRQGGSRLQAGIWNVASGVRTAWLNAISSADVVAVLAGHLHSFKTEDYRTRFATNPASGASQRLYIAPPLAVKNQNDQTKRPKQARGLTIYEYTGSQLDRDVVWLDPMTGFADERRALREAGATSPSSLRIPLTERLLPMILGLFFAAIGVLWGFRFRRWRHGTWALDKRLWWLDNLVTPALPGTALTGSLIAVVLEGTSANERLYVIAVFLAGFLGFAVLIATFLYVSQAVDIRRAK